MSNRFIVNPFLGQVLYRSQWSRWHESGPWLLCNIPMKTHRNISARVCFVNRCHTLPRSPLSACFLLCQSQAFLPRGTSSSRRGCWDYRQTTTRFTKISSITSQTAASPGYVPPWKVRNILHPLSFLFVLFWQMKSFFWVVSHPLHLILRGYEVKSSNCKHP